MIGRHEAPKRKAAQPIEEPTDRFKKEEMRLGFRFKRRPELGRLKQAWRHIVAYDFLGFLGENKVFTWRAPSQFHHAKLRRCYVLHRFHPYRRSEKVFPEYVIRGSLHHRDLRTYKVC